MTVSDQIIKVLDALCLKFGMAIDWTNENVIPYITTLCAKLISYEIWTSVAWIGIMVVLSIISTIIVVKYRIFSSDFVNKWDIVACILQCLFIVIWIGAVICVGVQVFDIIKCVTFPEMYVFEYVQGLVNGS